MRELNALLTIRIKQNSTFSFKINILYRNLEIQRKFESNH
jgi:hypothetical protein